ncbi:MAG: methyltransferase domain-containing protein [Anaerolineales bacterium]
MAKPDHTKPDVWTRAAPDYEDMFLPLSSQVAAAALRRIKLDPGDRFLDVAAGTGAVTLQAVEMGAEVTAIDYAEGMLGFLRDKLTESDIDSVAVRVMDGQALDFDDDSFDAAGSNLGLVFFEDPLAGLRELKRVVRPGGRVFITSLAQSPPSVFSVLIDQAITKVTPNFHPQGPVARYSFAGPDQMVQGLRAGGFSQADAELEEVEWRVGDYAEYWDRWVMGSPPSAAAMRQLEPDLVAKAKAEYIKLCQQEGPKYPQGFPIPVVIGLGRV